MPEGDTIRRDAARLTPLLLGRRAEVVMPRRSSPAPSPVEVRAIRVHGKHLLVDLDPAAADPVVLHVHLGMPGRWHLRSPAPTRPPSGRDLRVSLTSNVGRADCHAAPVAELVEPSHLARHPVLARLGPDLGEEGVDLDDVVARTRTRGSRPLHVALLDQGTAAGLGNVLATEACHLAGIDPRTLTGALTDDQLLDVYARGRRLLVDNVARARRTTVPGAPPGSLWVYGREHRPCRRCGTRVVATSLGPDRRRVAWCPACQPAPPSPSRPA